MHPRAEYLRRWRAANPERQRAYKRAELLRNAVEHARFPKPSSVERHELTHDELQQIADAVSRRRGRTHFSNA